MIFTEKKVTINNNQSTIDSPIVLYRGDYNVEVRFTLISSPYKYSKKDSTNIIEQTEASYGQLVIKTPNDKPPIFSETTPTNNGAITFIITGEMIDEIAELGEYAFQIRLFDEEKGSRATIAEVVNGIEIREPIALEDVTTTNEVGEATVGHALITTSSETLDTFDEQGNYIKTDWNTGDKITAPKLNKIEHAIGEINDKTGNYVTKETGNASQITFADGQTFQAKLDAGTLKGDAGPQGEQGPAGEDGAQGAKGDKGDAGYTPVKGVDYFDGAKGDKGDIGPQGPQGEKGDKGDPGEQGEIGPQGPKGDKGDKGDTGAAGKDGLTTSITVNGSTYSHVQGTITLPDYPTVPSKTSDLENDSDFVNSTYVQTKIAEAALSGGEVDLSGYVTKETGNASQITFSDGQTFQAKLDAGTLKGDVGPQGEQGLQGPQGLKGDKGDTGAQGPQGEKGEQGLQGIQGEQGPAGADGYTPIKGVDYFDGAQGPQGEKGDKGDKGDTGANGQDGLTTAISVNGTTYTHVDGVITLPDYPSEGTGGTDTNVATDEEVAQMLSEVFGGVS